MHARPDLFGGLDQKTLSRIYSDAARQAPFLSLWVPVAGVLIAAFALNTLCCLLEWLSQIRRRWRKLGEYLIHLGFCLLVIAFFWGDLKGERQSRQVFLGEKTVLEKSNGLSIRVDDLRPVFDEKTRRPLEIVNHLTLFKDGQELSRQTIGANRPLVRDGYIVLPASYGQSVRGFTFSLPGRQPTLFEAGTRIQLTKGKSLQVIDFAPHARRMNSQVINFSERLVEPAFQLRLTQDEAVLWEGWYFLRHPVPEPLRQEGVKLRPLAPVEQTYAILTVNHDPAIQLAKIGGYCMTGGVFWALFSYYAKRRRKDRPEIV
jgi:cytochrome c biogenesis protein